jgi:predicted regulator of Ras-like GTPase activity (Roadblock/LC7/MglB family)
VVRVVFGSVTIETRAAADPVLLPPDEPLLGAAEPTRRMESDTVAALAASLIGAACLLVAAVGLIELCVAPFGAGAVIAAAVGAGAIMTVLLASAAWVWRVDRMRRGL